MKYKYSIKNTWHPIIHREKKGYLEFGSVDEIISWLGTVEKEYLSKYSVHRVSIKAPASGNKYLMILLGTENRYEISLEKVGDQKGGRSYG